METAGATLLILGAVSIIAALVGGSLKLLGNTEFPPLKSPVIRILLGSIGSLFVLWGLALVVGFEEPTSPGSQESNNSQAKVSPDDEVATYLADLHEICRARGEEVSALNQPRQDDHQSIVDWLFQMSVIHEGWRNEVNDVPRPPGATNAALRELLAQHDVLVEESNALFQAASAGDEARYRQHLAPYTQATDKLGSAFRAYGLDCPF